MKEIGYLFDLDGVLIDSEREYTRIWNQIDEAYPSGKEDFAQKIKGQTLNKILTENYPVEQREAVNAMLHNLEGTMHYDYCEGAEQLLDRLASSNSKVAVVTSSDSKKMAHLYDVLPSFREKVNHIVDASKIRKSKPDPEGYLLAADELGVDIRNCVVFEDSVQGVQAGKASGAYVIGITGTKTYEELEPYSDTVIDRIEDIRIDELKEQILNR